MTKISSPKKSQAFTERDKPVKFNLVNHQELKDEDKALVVMFRENRLAGAPKKVSELLDQLLDDELSE